MRQPTSGHASSIAAGAAALVLLWTCWPSSAAAQWVEAPGQGWVNVSVSHHDTRDRFDPSGNVTSIFNEGGRSITSSLFVTAVYGVVRGVDAWAEVPLHHLQFNDVVADRASTGLGDPRVHLRVAPVALGWSMPVPVAVRVGVKVPLGDFPVDSEIVPLTEGQADVEALLEVGHSFWPRQVYVMAWWGYRWRLRNDEIDRKPGDEWLVYAALGGAHSAWSGKLAVEGLFGTAPEVFGIPLTIDRRRLLTLQPTLGRRIGPGTVEVGVRVPVAGRNLLAGPIVVANYFLRWPRLRGR